MIARRGIRITLLASAASAAALLSATSAASAAPTPASTLLSASAAAAPSGAAAPATSSSFPNHTTQDFVNIRLEPDTSHGSSGQAQVSDVLEDYCYVIGEEIDGHSAWDKVTDTATGKSGYITETLLADTSQDESC
jgi:hypothetical protein